MLFQELLRRMCSWSVPGCGKLFAGKGSIVLALALALVGAKILCLKPSEQLLATCMQSCDAWRGAEV